MGRSCVEQYRKGQTTSAEQQWKICDHVDNVNWTALIAGRQFVFFQGLDSPGGDYLVGGEEAAEACRTTQHCVAYNTNGILKQSLQPPRKWVHWTDDPHHGLYVLDIDYCQLSLEKCPSHSRCERNGPANYSCQCIAPYHLPGKSGSCEVVAEEHKQQEVRGLVRCSPTLHSLASSLDICSVVSRPAPPGRVRSPSQLTMETHIKWRSVEGVYCRIGYDI